MAAIDILVAVAAFAPLKHYTAAVVAIGLAKGNLKFVAGPVRVEGSWILVAPANRDLDTPMKLKVIPVT